jgi:hypothetical protein
MTRYLRIPDASPAIKKVLRLSQQWDELKAQKNQKALEEMVPAFNQAVLDLTNAEFLKMMQYRIIEVSDELP